MIMANNSKLNYLIELASKNTDESWEQVNKIIEQPGFCDQDIIWQFAISEGLNHHDPNIWDLASSIIAQAKNHRYQLPNESVSRLKLIVNNKDQPEAIYARYRSAFALFENDIKTSDVMSAINDAADDEAVSDLAKIYLNS